MSKLGQQQLLAQRIFEAKANTAHELASQLETDMLERSAQTLKEAQQIHDGMRDRGDATAAYDTIHYAMLSEYADATSAIYRAGLQAIGREIFRDVYEEQQKHWWQR